MVITDASPTGTETVLEESDYVRLYIPRRLSETEIF